MSDREVTVGVLVCVFDLTASLDLASDIFPVPSPISQLNCCASKTLSSSEKRSCSGQSKRARTSVERPQVKAVPEAVRNRPMPQSAPFKAVLECVRSRAPPPPEGTPLRERPTWPVPPSAPPPLEVSWKWKASNVGRMGSMRTRHGMREYVRSSMRWTATWRK